MTQDLTVYQAENFDNIMRIGTLLAQSGFFADSRGAAQAVTKMMAGAEIGFGPIASMTGIHVISGRVSISANLMAAAIKRSGRYDYRVLNMTPDLCTIEFRERVGDKWEVIGKSEFTKQDAIQAGTKNMDKYARNMLFARAMSNGARWFTPDIFGGPVYTPEEMGAIVDGETGEVIDAPAPRIVMERQHEPASGAGKQPQDPPGFSVWADWSKPEHAIQWGLSQGVFDHQKHAENAYAKCKAACQPTTARQMWECWYEDVQQRSHAKAAGHTITDAELDGEPVDETPQFS